MPRTTKERLEIADAELDRAFRLINDLWANKDLGLFIALPTHTKKELAIREQIVSTRIAIMKASNQIELLIDNN
jgi:hypothetical protein